MVYAYSAYILQHVLVDKARKYQYIPISSFPFFYRVPETLALACCYAWCCTIHDRCKTRCTHSKTNFKIIKLYFKATKLEPLTEIKVAPEKGSHVKKETKTLLVCRMTYLKSNMHWFWPKLPPILRFWKITLHRTCTPETKAACGMAWHKEQCSEAINSAIAGSIQGA